MRLINLDDLTIIGAGSEWFWTAFSGLVLAVTFVAIYRQLSLARSANAIEQLANYAKEWESERMLRHRLTILEALRDGTDPRHLPTASATQVGNYWDSVGVLAHGGHLALDLIDSPNCQLWWATLAGFTDESRAQWKDPTIVKEWEWLARTLAERDRRSRSEVVDYHGTLMQNLPMRIKATEGAIAVEEALRAVTMTPRDTTPADASQTNVRSDPPTGDALPAGADQ